MNAHTKTPTPSAEAYNALLQKHGGFAWRFPGDRTDSLVFASNEDRDAFDREWMALGGSFEPDPPEEDIEYHGDWTAKEFWKGGGY